MLSKFLGVTFPQNIKQIDAYVGLIPVFLRYIDRFSFSISTGVVDWKLVEIVANETLHFYSLRNGKNVFRNTYKTFRFAIFRNGSILKW